MNNSSALCAKSAHLSSHLISHSSHGQVYSFIFGLHLVGLQLSIAFTDLSGIQLFGVYSVVGLVQLHLSSYASSFFGQ